MLEFNISTQRFCYVFPFCAFNSLTVSDRSNNLISFVSRLNVFHARLSFYFAVLCVVILIVISATYFTSWMAYIFQFAFQDVMHLFLWIPYTIIITKNVDWYLRWYYTWRFPPVNILDGIANKLVILSGRQIELYLCNHYMLGSYLQMLVSPIFYWIGI